MDEKFSYQDYVTDNKFLDGYNEYQKKYAASIRESDKIVINLVKDFVNKNGSKTPLKLLDIGCSTGNLLRHIKYQVPGLKLYGGDLAKSSLEICKKDPELKDITFQEMNILELKQRHYYQIVIVNAVIYMMKNDEARTAYKNIANVLSSGGILIVFDFSHPFQQELIINEKSKTHPEGLLLHFRPETMVTEFLYNAGFKEITFTPFKLPIDLERVKDDSELITYTRMTNKGERLAFRGALFQPWCHITAIKK